LAGSQAFARLLNQLSIKKAAAAGASLLFHTQKGSSGTFLAAFRMAHLIFVLDAF